MKTRDKQEGTPDLSRDFALEARSLASVLGLLSHHQMGAKQAFDEDSFIHSFSNCLLSAYYMPGSQ